MEEAQPQDELSKKERRALKRESREDEMRALRTKNTIRTFLYIAGALTVFVAAGFGLKWLVAHNESTKPGVFFPSQGREHIAPGASHDAYNSLPPTSGWHYASPAPWGIYTEPIPDEVQVHNLEHGGIMVQYKPGIDQQVIDELTRIVKKYPSKVILAPYPKLDQDIALTAWERLDKFSANELSEERVMNFIRRLKDKGPEYIPD